MSLEVEAVQGVVGLVAVLNQEAKRRHGASEVNARNDPSEGMQETDRKDRIHQE